MKKGATIVLLVYAAIVALAGIYWSPLAALIIGVVGLGALTAWSCAAINAPIDDWEEENLGIRRS